MVYSSPTLSTYSDGDWASDVTDHKSTTEFLLFLGDSLISQKSKKQSVISLTDTTSEIIWLRQLLSDLGVQQSQPKSLHYDSKSAIHISHNDVFHK